SKYMANSKPQQHQEQITSYYAKIQRRLFIKLINGCFQTSVFYLNPHPYANEKIELTFNLANNEHVMKYKTNNTSSQNNDDKTATAITNIVGKLNKKPNLSSIYLVNADLL